MISEYPLKRSCDFILASLALAISFPLWVIIALAIRLEDGGPVLYRQKRWGKENKEEVAAVSRAKKKAHAHH